MRALLVGCGAMAAGWADAILKNPLIKGQVKIIGLVDPNLDAANRFAAQHGLHDAAIFASIKDALEFSKPDVVFDITPPSVRAEVVTASLNAGIHVLSEKPMAASLQEAVQLNKLANERGCTFAITQNRRFKPGVRRVGEFLSQGGIGEITGIHADFFIGARFGGFRDHMEHVLLLDMAIHHFDAARFLTNQRALSVLCMETNPKGSWYDTGASAFATFEMSGDCFFTYRGSWCAEGVSTSWDASWRITGSKGTLIWDGEENFTVQLGTGEPIFLRETIDVDVPELTSDRQTQEHASVIASFLEAIGAGEKPETDSSDNLHSMAMVFGAIESSKTAQLVTISGEE